MILNITLQISLMMSNNSTKQHVIRRSGGHAVDNITSMPVLDLKNSLLNFFDKTSIVDARLSQKDNSSNASTKKLSYSPPHVLQGNKNIQQGQSPIVLYDIVLKLLVKNLASSEEIGELETSDAKAQMKMQILKGIKLIFNEDQTKLIKFCINYGVQESVQKCRLIKTNLKSII